jgi:hypothetical protein
MVKEKASAAHIISTFRFWQKKQRKLKYAYSKDYNLIIEKH